MYNPYGGHHHQHQNHNPYANQAALQREFQSDAWIQRNVPGGLNSPMGQALDNYYGGNPNPTLGQQVIGGAAPNYGSHGLYYMGHHH